MNGRNNTSWKQFHDHDAGRIVWFAFEPPQGARSVTLTPGRPQAAITGPWTITLPVER